MQRAGIWLLRYSRNAALGFSMFVAVTGPAFAACGSGGASPDKVSDFISNPGSLLGSGDVASDVRDLVTADPATLSVVIGLLNKVPPPSQDQQKAIGTGLGLAANLCIRPDPTFAGEIQKELVATNSSDAKREYAAITGNQLIGTVGGGGGGGSTGASGGQTSALGNAGTSSGFFQSFATSGVSGVPTNYFSGGVSGISASSSTTNAASSVSPSTR